jgi:hypothetical protein
LSPESEKRRARAGEDLALAFFLADRDPLWAVVALFYGVHHLLIALSQERAPGPFTPRKYSEALSLFRQAGLAKEVRKAYEKLLELSWQARYEPLTREEGRELWREALKAYEALREVLGGAGGLPGGPGA